MSSASGDAAAPSPAESPQDWDPEEVPPIEGPFNRTLAAVCTVLLVGILATVLLQVVMRYFVNSPLTWTDEVTRLQLVWLTFIGAVLAYRLRSDIAVDALQELARKRNWRVVAGAAFAIVQTSIFVVAVLFVVAGWLLAEATTSRSTPALGIPVTTFYAVVPLAGLLLVVSVVQRVRTSNPTRNTGADR